MQHVTSLIKFSFTFGLIIMLTACGNADESLESLPSPTTNGVTTTSAYPQVVKVIAPGGSGLCTGTFISEKAVLTAAHCTLKAGTYTVVASFGTFFSSTVINYGPGVLNDPNDISIIVFNTNVADRSLGQVADMADDVRSGDTLRLVGFGCNNLDTGRGAGVKRTGTNMVYTVTDYVNFVSPKNSNGIGARGILGPSNRAASCFGDSGGPALRDENGSLKVAAVTHAGGSDGEYIYSEYANVGSRSDNRNFIASVSTTYALGVQGL